MAQTILVIDDDPDIRTVAQVALAGLGYIALDTDDPQKALRIAKEQPVDLLLTDVVMPPMKGTELADRVQAVSPTTKVLLMSRIPNLGYRALWPRFHGEALRPWHP